MGQSIFAPAPASLNGPVKAWTAALSLPTYQPLAADRNPMFLEKRVFQGSSGKVYPLPFIDRIEGKPVNHDWRAIYLENEYIRVIILPELGGRIYAAVDKINGYDFIYRNPAIKPALVGLAGPWISGGIEFNWPQHHRPSTYMPTDWVIEDDEDGGCTVWLSEHEPMNRMKGMHGVRLRPGAARLELSVRLHNRTPLPQTIMWWANVAADVHEQYQSFFPPDVRRVADHAKRAMSAFPFCQDRYYGVNYGERRRTGASAADAPRQFVPDGSYAANDLRWYANIPVPTSYMCVDSEGDFFGGYDHRAEAGLVHVADRHVSPGKKQWTWGNHDFGYAWDRNLTVPDTDGVFHPYIELMAGVYTDNQPDFSFIAPGETKTFAQFWYPIRKIGPADQATEDVAVSLRVNEGSAIVGIHAVIAFPGALVRLEAGGSEVDSRALDLRPQQPQIYDVPLPAGVRREDLRLRIAAADGRILIDLGRTPEPDEEPTEPAVEPPDPADVGSADELYLTGLHLSQYRHATRAPELYWREAVKRDPLDSRCNNALGLWHFRRGELDLAERCFRHALKRLRRRNPNPYDGEAFYNLGLTLRLAGQDKQAYDAFSKAAWNAAWIAPSHLALAEIDAARGAWAAALRHAQEALRYGVDNLRARDLKAFCLRRLGREEEAHAQFEATLAVDPLDYLARDGLRRPLSSDPQIILDLSLDYARMGDFRRAFELTAGTEPPAKSGAAPLLHYYAAYFAAALGRAEEARRHRLAARAADSDYCFPSRVEEIPILRAAIDADPSDPKAPYYLGNLLYDKRRHTEAIALWERSSELDPGFSVVWRNLGVGHYNISGRPEDALAAYDNAHRCAPDDARVFYERDQLWKRVGFAPNRRLEALNARADLVALRDDLCIEFTGLLNQTGQPDKALAILLGRSFQPFEGGEGAVLEEYARCRLKLGHAALTRSDPVEAQRQFEAALTPPTNLGEARHLLANQSDVRYWAGVACAAIGERERAADHWRAAAEFRGDFLGMEVHPFSEKTFYSLLAMKEIGLASEFSAAVDGLEAYARDLMKKPAAIDYFATSLPTMLIFDEDIQRRQNNTACVMLAQACMARGERESAEQWLRKVLRQDPSHAHAADLLAELSSSL